jgi:hypothetical protein
VHASQAPEAIDGDSNAFEVRKFNAAVIADHDVFDVAAAINQRSDLPASLVRKLGKLSRKFRGQNLVRRDAPGVKLFYAAKLIRLEARSVSDYVLDNLALQSGSHSARRGKDECPFVFTIIFRAAVTGGVMRAVNIRRQLVVLNIALRYRFA